MVCHLARDQFACMELIEKLQADLIQLDPGMGYTAGEYNTMLPLVAEKYSTGEPEFTLEHLSQIGNPLLMFLKFHCVVATSLHPFMRYIIMYCVVT